MKRRLKGIWIILIMVILFFLMIRHVNEAYINLEIQQQQQLIMIEQGYNVMEVHPFAAYLLAIPYIIVEVPLGFMYWVIYHN